MRHAALPTDAPWVPAQVDGEPWQQAAAVLEVGYRGAALMLRRLDSAPLARMAAAVSEALDACQVPPAAAAAVTSCAVDGAENQSTVPARHAEVTIWCCSQEADGMKSCGRVRACPPARNVKLNGPIPQAKALISPAQRHALTTELAAHLHSIL